MSSRSGLLAALFLALLVLDASSVGQVVKVGAGSYATSLPPGARQPQDDIFAAPELTGPMPTNRWWSSLVWLKYSERQYPHPLAVQAGPGGLRVYYPGPHLTANRGGVFGSMPDATGEDLVLGHSAVERFPDARVESFSDWLVTARFGDKSAAMSVSYGHGSPFIYALFEGGSARITFTDPPKIWSGDAGTAVLGLTIHGAHYALFGPTGSRWDGVGGKILTSRSGSKRYFSLALLPDARPQTLELFARYAYVHVTATRMAWEYDPARSAVITKFSLLTHAFEGQATGALFALYPHQWRHSDAKLTGHDYASVRGTMKLAEGTSFTTTTRFTGVLPALPAGGAEVARMRRYLDAELTAPPDDAGRNTYWEGKSLGRLADQVAIAEQYGLQQQADGLRERIRNRLEDWLSAVDSAGARKRQRLFYHNARWGALIGYPAGYGSDTELNDHHFHYGYFIRAAAEIARRDPAWAADARFGGMINLLIRDIADSRRDDPQFPFLRNFDPYAGHSWASGTANFGDGNNQESSSEAINAWYGLIVWGEAINDPRIRDLGIYLYATEADAAREYWLDVRADDFAAAKLDVPPVLAMLWGGKGVNATWFSARPEVVHAINWMPIHGGSTYLGAAADEARRNYDALVAARGGNHWEQWPDLIWMYRALSDPADALAQFNLDVDRTTPEPGNSRANLYHWLAAFNTFGPIDGTVAADVPLYAVFRKGDRRTYAAYNCAAQPRDVHFSDGFKLRAASRALSVGSAAVQ